MQMYIAMGTLRIIPDSSFKAFTTSTYVYCHLLQFIYYILFDVIGNGIITMHKDALHVWTPPIHSDAPCMSEHPPYICMLPCSPVHLYCTFDVIVTIVCVFVGYPILFASPFFFFFFVILIVWQSSSVA